MRVYFSHTVKTYDQDATTMFRTMTAVSLLSVVVAGCGTSDPATRFKQFAKDASDKLEQQLKKDGLSLVKGVTLEVQESDSSSSPCTGVLRYQAEESLANRTAVTNAWKLAFAFQEGTWMFQGATLEVIEAKNPDSYTRATLQELIGKTHEMDSATFANDYPGVAGLILTCGKY